MQGLRILSQCLIRWATEWATIMYSFVFLNWRKMLKN